MTDKQHWLPVTRENIQTAHSMIRPYIYETPVLTSKTLNSLASTPQPAEALIGTPFEGQQPACPKIKFFFKCENFQRIGAFKVRGAFHSILRVIKTKGEEEVRKRGVITHSSGLLSLPVFISAIPALSLCLCETVRLMVGCRKPCSGCCSRCVHSFNPGLHYHAVDIYPI